MKAVFPRTAIAAGSFKLNAIELCEQDVMVPAPFKAHCVTVPPSFGRMLSWLRESIEVLHKKVSLIFSVGAAWRVLLLLPAPSSFCK